jgi:hypothetical protein
VVFGTIPDVTRIAFLVDRADLIRFLGSDFGLPADSRTSLEALVLVKLGLDKGTIFSDPNFVLDANELQTISAHVNALNDVILNVAAAHGMAIADIHAVFDFVASNPPVVAGVPLTTRFLGGAFSLGGVHPSNIAQAIIANIFIDQFNAHYNTNTPPIDNGTLFFLFLTDPFVDKDGDGRVTGRPGAGLLETLSALLGFSGDLNDFGLPAPFIVGIITPDDWRERCGERDGCHEFLQRVPAANRTRSPKDVPDGAIEGTRGAVRPANAEVALPTPYAHLVTRFRNGIRSASWRGRLKAQGLRTSAGRSIF